MRQRNYRRLFENFAHSDSYRDFAFFAVNKILKPNLVVIFLISSSLVLAQEPYLSEVITNIAEELAANDSESDEVTTYIEKLFDLSEDPVKLNLADENEISRLFFLSDFQVKVLADYVQTTGKIISVYELANIPGFDDQAAKMLVPFIKLDIESNLNTDYNKLRNTLLTNISVKPGKNDTTLLGSPYKTLTKYKFTNGSLSGGFTCEKDAGEKLFSNKSPLPDFFSAHIGYKGGGFVRKLIIGDYSARFGQGTAINKTLRTALSLTAQGFMSARDEIKPYTSTDENNFYRGVAAEFSLKNLGVTLFFSRNQYDATLSLSPDTSELYIENFYRSGLHMTSGQLLKKDAVSEFLTGANLSYNLNSIKIGIVWLNNKFSYPLKPDKDIPENIFDFQGYSNRTYSVYYNSLIKKFLIFGELSIMESDKYAFVQGISFKPSDRLDINFLYRKYDAGYTSIHGKGPGNSTVTGNEHGITANFIFEAAKHLFISGGADIYCYPWLKYRCSSPSMGKRHEIRIKYMPAETLIIDASYNNRATMTDDSETNGIPELKLNTTNTIKASVRYAVTENLTLTTRGDYKIVNSTGNKGMLLLQDINYRFSTLPFTVWGRCCIFNTSGWDSRLYTYENDLLYSYSIPALSGRGLRSYIMVKWVLGYLAEIRMKYGLTSLIDNTTTTGERSEVKLQFRMRF